MIQCEQCEFFSRTPNGGIRLACDPFKNVKEPECLTKWQLIKIDQMVSAYHATLDYYRKFAPMQEKMFKVVERELDDMGESEKWKVDEEEKNSHDDLTDPDGLADQWNLED